MSNISYAIKLLEDLKLVSNNTTFNDYIALVIGVLEKPDTFTMGSTGTLYVTQKKII